jgi:chemotaxis protein methyltransferase CheR
MESTITDQEFALFQRLIYKIAGISLSEAKKVLLVGRLTKRLKHYNFGTFSQYYRMLAGGHHPEEMQVMVDLLTTNETYFFREPGHFHFLRDEILAPRRSTAPFRVWSAACSSGEEVHPRHAARRHPAQHAVGGGRLGHQHPGAGQGRGRPLPLGRHEGIPPDYLRKYCLKGVRSHSGTFLVTPELKRRTRFHQVNLTLPVDAALGSSR